MKYYEAFKDHVFKEYSKIWENIHDIELDLRKKERKTIFEYMKGC